ncbi:hypothetical protein BC03BB108_E0019 (plasmid) [Bacillus cereus 03BB108]|nr:hypothetical protein BC03BB108_E0019 [Bacillus cereus 03BB108]
MPTFLIGLGTGWLIWGVKDIYQIAAERVNDVCDIPLCTVMEVLEIDPNEIVSLMSEIEEG